VVLVILAILAAILVPTLLGYIKKARDEKDYATAQTVRVAAQSVYAENYGNSIPTTTIATTNATTDNSATTPTQQQKDVQEVIKLAGVDPSKVTEFSFAFDSTGKMTGAPKVKINGSTYTYTVVSNTWSGVS
jgi:type IV pilus assembly protein PilA